MTCIHYKETLTALRGVRLSTKSCAMGIPSSNLPEHCEHCSMRTEDAYVRCPICDRTLPSGVDMSYDGDWAMCKDCAKRLKGERMRELKPCPFCGCEVSVAIRDYPIVKIRHYSIVHPENGCILEDYESPEISAHGELVDKWNRRVSE